MKASLLCLAYASVPKNNRDAIFHAWCADVGIRCPGAEVRTTPASVAGRGVFATKPVARGEEVVAIPHRLALTRASAGATFPALARALAARRTPRRGWFRRVADRVRRRPRAAPLSVEEAWPAELTAYALAALDADHAWAAWIRQWQRDDPFQALVDRGTWASDEGASIGAAVAEFGALAPAVASYKVHAATGIRLEELDEYAARYGAHVPTSASMYATLSSRAVGLSEDVTAILPMHDMVNHSPEPNLSVAFTHDGYIALVAERDIPQDAELFFRYNQGLEDEQGNWDDDKAAWLLVQWGIPSSPPERDEERGGASSSVGEKEPRIGVA